MFLGRIKKKMKITIEQGHYYFKILINGMPHVVIEKKEFKGFHAWNDTESDCSIEWITKTNRFKTTYDSIQKWKQLLSVLNENL